MNCYFCDSRPEPPGAVTLDPAESQHAASARRQQVGDCLLLIDGDGTRGEATITSISRRSVALRIESRVRVAKPKPELTVAAALPKGERQKVMLDMATQLGVDTFVPLHCAHSTVKPNAATTERWLRVCKAACKQSNNPFLPSIATAETPVGFVRSMRRLGVPVWVADRSGEPFGRAHDRIGLCVGPEGGFSEEEADSMLQAGARFVCLAPNIVRVETAVVAAVSLVRQNL